MAEKNPYFTTTISTIFATIVSSVAIYLRTHNLKVTDIIIFAVGFWIVFFLFQRYFSKRLEKKKVRKK